MKEYSEEVKSYLERFEEIDGNFQTLTKEQLREVKAVDVFANYTPDSFVDNFDLELFSLKVYKRTQREKKQRIRELQRQTKSPKNKKERKKAKLAKQSRKTNR